MDAQGKVPEPDRCPFRVDALGLQFTIGLRELRAEWTLEVRVENDLDASRRSAGADCTPTAACAANIIARVIV
jgi:hypothetical protein